MVDKVEKSKPGNDDSHDKETSQSTAEASTIGAGSEGQKNRAIYDQTQQEHKIGDSATNLLIPQGGIDQSAALPRTADSEAAKARQLGIVDEQKGIVHTGAGVLPHLPENITESYGENLKAIRPAKSEEELQDKVASATLTWMREKGMIEELLPRAKNGQPDSTYESGAFKILTAAQPDPQSASDVDSSETTVHGALHIAQLPPDLADIPLTPTSVDTTDGVLVQALPPAIVHGPADRPELDAQIARMEGNVSVLADTPELIAHRRDMIESAGRIEDPATRARFFLNMEAFERRAATQNPKITQHEMAETYRELSRMLDTPDAASRVPAQFRQLAAQQFMLHAAHPETMSQGDSSDCHCTCLAHRWMTRNPATLAEMMATGALTGGWTAPDHFPSIIAPNSLQPGALELNDPPHEGDRSYAIQLLNLVMINDIKQREVPPGYYIERHPAPDHTPGDDWNNQWLLKNSVDTLNGTGVGLAPGVMWNVAHGQAHDNAPIIVNDHGMESNDVDLHNPNLIHISSKTDLARELRNAKAHNRMPVIISVDEMQLTPPHSRDGINHVISITDIHNDGTVDIFNPQIIPHQSRTARLSLDVVYNASASKKPAHR